jgi:hypothetical protein
MGMHTDARAEPDGIRAHGSPICAREIVTGIRGMREAAGDNISEKENS